MVLEAVREITQLDGFRVEDVKVGLLKLVEA